MANEKDKKIENDQETIRPDEGNQDELSEKDLGETSGGGFEKWITFTT